MGTTDIVRDYYDQSTQIEWERLEAHPFEFEITRRFMERYIHPGDRVLDVGGGPGRYSLYLAEKGCEVTLVDLAPANVAFATQKAAERGLKLTAMAGDAREVDRLTEGLFDHVLLMGPLYHLLEENARVQAITACLKRLKPGGTFFASFISSYAGILYSMKEAPELIAMEAEEKYYEAFIGDHSYAGPAFTHAFFIRHADIAPLMSRFPLEKLHLFGQEGILAPNEHTLLAQSPEIVRRWIDLAEKVCEREDLQSFSEHFMYVGRKAP